MNLFIGIDLGGTNIKSGLVDMDAGKIICSKSVPTLAREGHEAVIDRMAGLVHDTITANGLSKQEIGGVGVGLPGLLDLEKGSVVFLPNLPGHWPNVPLRDELTKRTGLPTAMLNDVRAITLGEWRFGAGQGSENMVCFAIGTGVGGGLVINNRLHLGIGGQAGELGHMTIDQNGPTCGCGNHGCLEVYASGPAIAAMGMKAVVQGRTSIIGKLVDWDMNKITPEVVSKAAAQGDAVALEIYETAGSALGVAAANVMVTVTPRKIVVGGGVAAAGELLLAPMRRSLKERVTVVNLETVEIVLASLGSNAGVMGLATHASQMVNGK